MDIIDAENTFREALLNLIQYGDDGISRAYRVIGEVIPVSDLDEELQQFLPDEVMPVLADEEMQQHVPVQFFVADQSNPSPLHMPEQTPLQPFIVSGQVSSSSLVASRQASPLPLLMPEQASSASSIVSDQATSSTSVMPAQAKGKKRSYTTEDGSTMTLRSKTMARVELPSGAVNMDKALTDTMKNQTQCKTELAKTIQATVRAMCPANRQLLLNTNDVTNLTLENQLDNIDNINPTGGASTSSNTPKSLLQHYENLSETNDVVNVLLNVLAWKARHITKQYAGEYKTRMEHLVYGTKADTRAKSRLVCHGKVFEELVKRYGVCAMFMVQVFIPNTIKRISVKDSIAFMNYADQRQGFREFMDSMETYVQEQLQLAINQETTTT